MAQQTQEQHRQAEEARMKSDTEEPLGRVIEIIGNSHESFDDAIRSAVKRASQTMRHITGVEIQKMTCKVDGHDIREYRVDMKLAFGVETKQQ